MGKLLSLGHIYKYFYMRASPACHKPRRLLLLLAVASLIWLYATGLWRLSAWQTPASYAIDALEVLARLKFSGEKGWSFFIDKTLPELGAPWGVDWSAYSMPDAPVFILFGKIGLFIGLIEASHLALLFAHLSAVGTFYFCSRTLGHRALFAAGSALLFGFSFYLCHRSLSHYSFTLAYIVPAQLLSTWLIGSSQRILASRPWQFFCLLTAFATGIGNPYFGFGYVQLLTLALVYQAAPNRRDNLNLGLTCFGLFAVTLIATNYSSLFAMLGDAPSLLQRNFSSTEVYGFRPIELLIPPASHRWTTAAEIGERYAAATSLKGELFSPYLGLAGICGLLLIATDAFVRLFQGRLGLRPAYAATSLWFMVFFIVGGLNSLLAFSGVDLFRAGNRYSIYLLTIALLALTSWASRRGRHLKPWAAFTLVSAIVLIGLWDQLPILRPELERQALSKKIATDRQLAHCLETQLLPNAAIFQLPVIPFLEQPPRHGMTDYELFRPWLFSEHLNFSYGFFAGDKPLRWQRWAALMPANLLCETLEDAGYAALYIHKAAFIDAGVSLRQQLIALGKNPLFDAGDHLVFALQVTKAIHLPNLHDARLDDPWDRVPVTGDQLQIYATTGWFALEQLGEEYWRWAGAAASITIWVAGNRPLPANLEFIATALRPASLFATLANQQIWLTTVQEQSLLKVSLPITLQPGANQIAFHYDHSPTRASATDHRRLGFRLINLRASIH